MVGSVAHQYLKITWLGHPLLKFVMIETKGRTVDGDVNILGFSWSEIHLLEAFEFFLGARQRRFQVADIQLNHLSTCAVARILYRDGGCKLAVFRYLLLTQTQIGKVKRGVAQPMSEGEKRLRLILSTHL